MIYHSRKEKHHLEHKYRGAEVLPTYSKGLKFGRGFDVTTKSKQPRAGEMTSGPPSPKDAKCRPKDTSMSFTLLHRVFLFSRSIKKSLQGINISHLRKRKIIFKSAFLGGYVSSQEGIHPGKIHPIEREDHLPPPP